MDLFGMGAGEILLVIIVALIIFGPGKIPEIARTLGKAVNTIKQTSSDLTSQIKKELEEEEAETRNHSPHPEVNSSSKTMTRLPPDTLEASSAEKNEPEKR